MTTVAFRLSSSTTLPLPFLHSPRTPTSPFFPFAAVFPARLSLQSIRFSQSPRANLKCIQGSFSRKQANSSHEAEVEPQKLRYRQRCCCIAKSLSMENVSSPSLYPLHHCKIIHLVRHAQGVHNIEGEKNHKAYMKPEYFDAPLTPLGWQQVDNLNRHVHDSGLYKRVELVITSPLLRTMQTAVGVFGGGGYTDRMDVLPLMVANAGNSDRSAISSLNCPPIMAVELCREHLGVHPCDKRRNVHEYQCLFPAIDFSQMDTDEDTLWKADVRETKAEVAARGMNFINWLLTRKEKEIAVVTHSGFLLHTLSQLGNDCHPLMKDDMSKRFKNCELRSMVLADKNMTGYASSITDYPGKIPYGPDIPSDVGDENENNHR